MEVGSDDNAYIWYMGFGAPGAKTYINIMNSSPLFRKIRELK